MRERSMLFSAPMVRAILNDSKTQTRRVLAPRGLGFIGCCCGGSAARWVADGDRWHCGTCGGGARMTTRDVQYIRCPYGQPGDRLWVRENGWERPELTPRQLREGADTWPPYEYDAQPLMCWADGELKGYGWKRRPSIHMPRWASRITLEITGVRVERLQEISETDALAEGIHQQKTTGWFSIAGIGGAGVTARAAYALLWNKINGPGTWDENPWVWVVEFKKIEVQN